jgi:hypothetical protein
MLRLLKYSGDHLHDGVYNVDASRDVSKRLIEMHEEIKRQ